MEGSQVYVCGIPEALQTIDALNGYFKRFGQITNLKIMPNSRNAFVSFANRAQAVACLDCPDPPMGEPRILVKWANNDRGGGGGGGKGKRPREGGGRGGPPPQSIGAAVAAGAPGSAAGGGRGGGGRGAGPSKWVKPKPAEKIEAQLQEQKALIAKLSSLKSKEERATLMKQLESLNASVQAALREQKEAAAKPSPSRPAAAPAAAPADALAAADPGAPAASVAKGEAPSARRTNSPERSS